MRKNKMSIHNMSLDFIFMLTKCDKTVPDAHERLKDVLAGGAKHIGFKDIGLAFDELRILAQSIKDGGATLYLEVVSLDERSEIKSAMAAMELDVDYLMGGTRPEVIAPLVKEHKLKYYPFAGRIAGHPSVLKGTMDDIVESAVRMAAINGVDGLDLLAYRFDGDVPALMKAVCKASSVPVVIAGSIDNEERIRIVREAGAAGFTVGTAAFNGDFPAKESGLLAQVASIAAINQLVHAQN
jgi:hypothetical protein